MYTGNTPDHDGKGTDCTEPMTSASRVITAADLLALPDDGCRYELVRGALRRMSPAGHWHGRLVMNIATPLDVYVRNHHLGVVYAAETGFLLATDPDTVRAADVAFVQRERVAAVGDTRRLLARPA